MVGELKLVAKCMDAGGHVINVGAFDSSSGGKSPQKSVPLPVGKCVHHRVFCLLGGCSCDSVGRG